MEFVLSVIVGFLVGYFLIWAFISTFNIKYPNGTKLKRDEVQRLILESKERQLIAEARVAELDKMLDNVRDDIKKINEI